LRGIGLFLPFAYFRKYDLLCQYSQQLIKLRTFSKTGGLAVRRETAAKRTPKLLLATVESNSLDAPVSETRTSAVYRCLRDDLLSGALAPGARLPMQELSKRYGLAFAPLREALFLLKSEGLVIASDHKGFRVPLLSAQEFEELAGTRMLLEGQALRLSVERGDDAWEARLVASFHCLSLSTKRGDHLSSRTRSDWERAHEEFHEALIAASASRLLLRLRAMLTNLVLRYRRIALDNADKRDHLAEHQAIMDAALSRNANLAIKRLSEHYELTTKFILKQLGPNS
jgi:GntR family carbon starvation induced transcriptional regulator